MDIYKSTNQEKKAGLVSLVLCIFFFFIVFVTQVIISTKIIFNSFNIHSIFLGCLSQLQLLISVMLVIKGGNKGYKLEVILNSLSIFASIILTVSFDFTCAIQIFISSMLIFMSCILLYHHMNTIQSTADAMYKKAITDDLTGLVNHKNFVLNIDDIIKQASNDTAFSIVFIDIDNFKRINDTLGHQVGDNFLIETVRNMLKVISPGDTLGRMGGDEFALLVPGNQNDTDLYRYVHRISEVVAVPFLCQNKEYNVTASFGIARFPKDGRTASDVIHQADMAMYRAKSLGKNKILFFDDQMQNALEKRMQLENALQKALGKNEMYLEYQPQYSVSDKSVRGYEALIRWNSSQLGIVSPSNFIGVAEETGTMISIGEWVIKTACEDFGKIKANENRVNNTKTIIAINISTVQLNDPGFIDFVENILKNTGMEASCLEFEVTERICELPQDTIIKVLSEIRRLGIRISLDDFGTGSSSLNNLRKLPLNSLKIDTSFTRSLIAAPRDGSLIKPLIEMAHDLKLQVIAEGVEKVEELELLKSYGCDFAQGFLFGHSGPINKL
ncbi:MAG: bifunctional diguanylate cyclase/phosphodiesterase [Treponema sp.]|nr:bifunctional diguanylate cyclase/phosphodiesterase [Treponema sp.]